MAFLWNDGRGNQDCSAKSVAPPSEMTLGQSRRSVRILGHSVTIIHPGRDDRGSFDHAARGTAASMALRAARTSARDPSKRQSTIRNSTLGHAQGGRSTRSVGHRRAGRRPKLGLLREVDRLGGLEFRERRLARAGGKVDTNLSLDDVAKDPGPGAS